MDIRLPRVSGLEATRQINNKLPQSMIMGMSSLYTSHSYNAMMAAGAVAFVRKEDAVALLYKTLAFALSTYYPHRRPSIFMTGSVGPDSVGGTVDLDDFGPIEDGAH